MKTMLLIGLIAIITMSAVPACLADTTTNNATGVSLTHDQNQQLDDGINWILTVLPSKYRGAIVGLIVLLSLVRQFWGAIQGAMNGKGFWGIAWCGIKGLFNHPPKVGLILILGLSAMVFTGCSSTNKQQFTDSLTGKGGFVNATIPVPATAYDIGIKFGVGVFNHTFAEQPVGTNKMYAPPMAVTAYGHGKQTVSTGTGGTNGATATVGAGSSDASVIVLGNMDVSNQMGTNEVLHVNGTQ